MTGRLTIAELSGRAEQEPATIAALCIGYGYDDLLTLRAAARESREHLYLLDFISETSPAVERWAELLHGWQRWFAAEARGLDDTIEAVREASLGAADPATEAQAECLLALLRLDEADFAGAQQRMEAAIRAARPAKTGLVSCLINSALARVHRWAGRPYLARKISHTSASGEVNFIHQHPAYTNRDHRAYPNRDWIRERVVWLAIHHPYPIIARVARVAPEREQGVGPDGRWRLDPRRLSAELQRSDPELFARAQLSFDAVDFGQLIARGLFAGATFGTSNSGGGESWARDGDLIRHEWHDFGHVEVREYTRSEVVSSFSNWGTVEDGLVVAGYSFPGAMRACLRALGVPTLRAYLLRFS